MQYNNIIVPTENDVLASGRGNRARKHPGNLRYHSWIKELGDDYAKCDKCDKPCYASAIVTQVKSLNPPGRFLKLNEETGLWSELESRKVLIKIRQALRESKGESACVEKEEKEIEQGGGAGAETEDDDVTIG